MLKRNPDNEPVELYDMSYYVGAVAMVWGAVFLPCLIVGAFLAGWLAIPLAALFASMLTAEIMEGIAA